MTDTWDISQHASGPQGPRSELVLPYQRPFGLRVSAREKKKSQHFNSLSIQFFTWLHLNIYRRRCRWMHVCARSHTHTHTKTHKDTQRRTHAGEHCMHVCTQAHTRAFVPILSDLFSSLWWKLKVEQGTVEKRQPWSCVCVCVWVCECVSVCECVCVSASWIFSFKSQLCFQAPGQAANNNTVSLRAMLSLCFPSTTATTDRNIFSVKSSWKQLTVAQWEESRTTNNASTLGGSIQQRLLQYCEMRMNSEIQIICCGCGLCGDYIPPLSTGECDKSTNWTDCFYLFAALKD